MHLPILFYHPEYVALFILSRYILGFACFGLPYSHNQYLQKRQENSEGRNAGASTSKKDGTKTSSSKGIVLVLIEG